MRLGDLIQGLPIQRIEGQPDFAVKDLTDDSRQVRPGWLFVARKGTAEDGARFIDDARSRGAAAVVSCDAMTLAHLAERVYGEPLKKLKLIGVTGTNGKTTIAYMVRHLVNAAGHKCGMMTTVEIDLGDGTPRPATLTTPGACEISRNLAAMVANDCDHAVMECSSHALDQGRCEALAFDVAVFTNLTGDHLDYHGSMEAYAAAKAKLFKRVGASGLGVVNGEDAYSGLMLDALGDRRSVVFGRGDHELIEARADGTVLRIRLVDGWATVRIPLVGGHNVSNLLAACGAVEAGREMVGAIERMPAAPGRLERVSEAGGAISVLVDYAHTDDALRNVLSAVRPLVGEGGMLRVMFGCGGDRDSTKRPRMAAVACEMADRVVITSDNPRTENAQSIINDILAGVRVDKQDRVTTIIDRREAIERIIGEARRGDIVLLAGKGHEDYQIIGTTKHAFDDRVEARRVLAELGARRRIAGRSI